MQYWVLKSKSPVAAVIDAFPAGGPPEYLYDKGTILRKKYPAKATISFSDNFPQLRKLADFQPNILNALIVSPKARAAFEGLPVRDVEYLPVAVKDHRGKALADDYAFMNVLAKEDAIDMKKSTYRMNALDKGQISSVDELVLDPQHIDPDARIFRCAMMLRTILVRDDVKKALEAAKLTGCVFFDANGWDGVSI